MSQYPPEFIEKYEQVGRDRLGGGKFGDVIKVKHKVTQEIYAAKVTTLGQYSGQYDGYMKQEVDMMKELTKQNCKNIIKFKESFENEDYIIVIMELCDDSLQKVFELQREQFTFQSSLHTLIQISIGIKSLHDRNIIHRDLKLANIMVNKNKQNNILKYEIKLIDFGFSKALQQEDLTQTLVGTEVTMAPEVKKSEQYHLPADIYSLGVLCFQLMTGSTYNEKITSEDQDTREFLTYVKQHMLCEQSQREQISQVIKYMESKFVRVRGNLIIEINEYGDQEVETIVQATEVQLDTVETEKYELYIPNRDEEHQSDVEEKQNQQQIIGTIQDNSRRINHSGQQQLKEEEGYVIEINLQYVDQVVNQYVPINQDEQNPNLDQNPSTDQTNTPSNSRFPFYCTLIVFIAAIIFIIAFYISYSTYGKSRSQGVQWSTSKNLIGQNYSSSFDDSGTQNQMQEIIENSQNYVGADHTDDQSTDFSDNESKREIQKEDSGKPTDTTPTKMDDQSPQYEIKPSSQNQIRGQ